MTRLWLNFALLILAICCGGCAWLGRGKPAVRPTAPAQSSTPTDTSTAVSPNEYRIQPGDILQVSVWKEPDLTVQEVLVRPDGGLSFPLAGDISASGKTVAALQIEFTERLKRYIPNPVVTVATKAIGGNRVYVIGKVQKPGEFPFVQPVDVMQALSMAGGATPYAALNAIVILRRDNGQLKSIPFRYADIEHGKRLAQDILLQSGDTVVVP